MKVEAGAFQRIYDPSIPEGSPWYINDHCFIQDTKGLWHMFGITHSEPAAPWDEKLFAHATSPDLLNPQWERHEHVMHADYEKWGEIHVWAPHVIRHDGTYYMYYCGGDDDHSRYKIQLATSKDLWAWERHPGNPMVRDGYHARDPMILRVGDQWVMYYTANRPYPEGNHVVAAVTSTDLIKWSEPRIVFTHPKIGTYGGPTESPFVVARDGKFYLFICLNEPYDDTGIFMSSDPFRWTMEDQVGYAPGHAAEVISLPGDKYYISRCGWDRGGLYLAELFFRG